MGCEGYEQVAVQFSIEEARRRLVIRWNLGKWMGWGVGEGRRGVMREGVLAMGT